MSLFKNIYYFFVKLWFRLKWVEEPLVHYVAPESIAVDTPDTDFIAVNKAYNRYSKDQKGFALKIHNGSLHQSLKSAVDVSIQFVDKFDQDHVDGQAFLDEERKYHIQIKKGLPSDKKRRVYAHELGHIFGHWHHGTCFLMQPKIPPLPVDWLIKDFCNKWINKSV